MKTINKTLSILLALTVVVSCFGVFSIPVSAASAPTTLQNKVVTIATNSSKYNITAKMGYSQKWVSDVYKKATGTYYTAESAKIACQKWRVSKSKTNIPAGAVVYGNTGKYGHCGIYLGNNKVAHNIGWVEIVPLSKWQKKYKYIGWGWNGKKLA